MIGIGWWMLRMKGEGKLESGVWERKKPPRELGGCGAVVLWSDLDDVSQTVDD